MKNIKSTSFILDKKNLENVVQLGWLGTPTNLLPSQLVELRIDFIKDHDSSWIKMMSNRNWVFRIVLMMELFLQTFCKQILIFSKFMLEWYL